VRPSAAGGESLYSPVVAQATLPHVPACDDPGSCAGR